MSPDKDKYLCAKFPKLFAERYLSPMQTTMCWGFEHGDGWFNIIELLCENIQHYIDHKNEDRERAIKHNKAIEEALDGNWDSFNEYWKFLSEESLTKEKEGLSRERLRSVPEETAQVVVNQVKEKYGTLRFYYTGGDDYIDGLVSMAEAMTARTCERCGNPGSSNGGGWISVRCNPCRDSQNSRSQE